MPVFFVFGVALTVITAMWILIRVIFYGTTRDLLILFAVACIIVFILYMVSI
jgi:hypothetical protein